MSAWGKSFGFSFGSAWGVVIITPGGLKVWNGTQFVIKPLKVFNGTSWVEKPLKRFDGNNWRGV